MAVGYRRARSICAILLWVLVPTASQAQQQVPLQELVQQQTDPTLRSNQSQNSDSQAQPQGAQAPPVSITVGGGSTGASTQTGINALGAGQGGTVQSESRLEQIYSMRAGVRLQQFGYDQFGRSAPTAVPQTGAMSDDYVLGPGDQILVSLRGQENGEFRATVDRNGQIVLPRLSPIGAAGRTFGSFRQDLEAAVHRAFVATEASISVGTVRQISVLVSGEVNNPGQRLVTGLSSPLDAILISGGVKKTGSLRKIRVLRNGRDYNVDLYDTLTAAGSGPLMRLADGDRILVPPLGPTVAVAGLVRQPGIFELPSRVSSLTVRNLLALAGGPEVRGRYRFSALRLAADGSSQMASVVESGTISDSEILFVQLGANQTVSQATLSGGTALAGAYAISPGTKLSNVLRSPGAMPPAPYTLFGIVARKDPLTLLRTLAAFTPAAVLNGSEDQTLQSDDIIRVLSVNEVRLLTNTVRLYTQRQASEQSDILNPLSEPDNTPINTNALGAVNTATQPSSQTASSASGQAGQTRRRPDQDVPANTADRQRRDIAELANLVDPVTLQTMEAENRAQQEQISGYQQSISPSSLANAYSGESSMPYQVNGVLPSENQAAATSTGSQANSDQPPSPIKPALNFQATDATIGQTASNREINNFGDLARQLGIDQLVLVNFLIDHQATLNGAVGGPGLYFVGPNVPLQALVQAAGGTTNWADESGVELVSTVVDGQTGHSLTRQIQLPLRQGTLANYTVHPRDQLRFNQVFTDSGLGSVTVQGEVRFGGTFQITRGEHLSDVLARAGGLTSTAYPYGTVFLRKSAAATERAGYNRAANEVEEELVGAMTRIGTDKIDSGSFAALQGFVTQLRNQKAIGRIAIAADPSVLATKPELDPLLEPGDLVYIPQRPSTVTVLGQVMQPGSLPYRSGYTLKDYITMAGGYGPTSDESDTFIVMPDGSARRIESSWLSFGSVNLPPGSSIVVPRDITPLDTRQLILDITGIFSTLAVTVASLAVLSHQ